VSKYVKVIVLIVGVFFIGCAGTQEDATYEENLDETLARPENKLLFELMTGDNLKYLLTINKEEASDFLTGDLKKIDSRLSVIGLTKYGEIVVRDATIPSRMVVKLCTPPACDNQVTVFDKEIPYFPVYDNPPIYDYVNDRILFIEKDKNTEGKVSYKIIVHSLSDGSERKVYESPDFFVFAGHYDTIHEFFLDSYVMLQFHDNESRLLLNIDDQSTRYLCQCDAFIYSINEDNKFIIYDDHHDNEQWVIYDPRNNTKWEIENPLVLSDVKYFKETGELMLKGDMFGSSDNEKIKEFEKIRLINLKTGEIRKLSPSNKEELRTIIGYSNGKYLVNGYKWIGWLSDDGSVEKIMDIYMYDFFYYPDSFNLLSIQTKLEAGGYYPSLITQLNNVKTKQAYSFKDDFVFYNQIFLKFSPIAWDIYNGGFFIADGSKKINYFDRNLIDSAEEGQAIELKPLVEDVDLNIKFVIFLGDYNDIQKRPNPLSGSEEADVVNKQLL